MSTNSRPERQHHITQAYLKLFSAQIKNRFKLWVCDLKTRSWRVSQPHNEALERDFQTVDHFIGLDPYFFEKVLSPIEGRAMEVVKKILKEGRIPISIEEFSPVINLMGLFAGRNLFERDRLEYLERRRSLQVLVEVHKNESTFRAGIGWVLYQYSIEWPCFSSYEESKRFLESGQFMIHVDRSLTVEKMETLAVSCVDLLGSHNWMLLEAVNSKFVTSNKPVNPVWTGHRRQMPPFGGSDTFVVFPISPRYALLGSWSPLPSYRKVDALIVEGVNWVTTNTGATQLFAHEKGDLLGLVGPFQLQAFHRLLSTRLIEHKGEANPLY